MKKNAIKTIFIQYVIISLALFTVLLCDNIYMIYNEVHTDLPYSYVILIHFIISFILGVIVTVLYTIFFSFIFRYYYTNIKSII